MSDGKMNAYLARMETMPADVQRRILLWLMELERRRLALLRAIQKARLNWYYNFARQFRRVFLANGDYDGLQYKPDYEGPGF